MNRAEISGVPVLWHEAPGPLTAILMFLVGVRDETYRTLGVTHLIGQLVLGSLPARPVDRDVTVGLDTTAFRVSGAPSSVVEFVRQVCAAISEPPLDRLPVEQDRIDADAAVDEPPALCLALTARYGACGPGLAGCDGAGISQLGEVHVRNQLRRHFTRDNAVLVLTGAPQPGLNLDLPSGSRNRPGPACSAGLPLPGWLSEELPLCTISLEVPSTQLGPASVVMRVLAGRLEDSLQQSRDLAYEIDWGALRVDDERAMVAVWVANHEGAAAAVAAEMSTELRTLAERGPAQAEITDDRAGLEEFLADPRLEVDRLQNNGWRLLTGQPLSTPEQLLGEHAALTPEGLRDLVRSALDTVLLQVPDGIEPNLPALCDLRDGCVDAPLSGRRFTKRLLSRAARDLVVIAGDDGVSLTVDGHTHSVRWDDVVGLAVADGARMVIGSSGRAVPVFARELRDGDRLLKMIDERVPAGVRFEGERI